MIILPLHREILSYLKKRNIMRKYAKQEHLFRQNPFHPSLGTELLEPRRMHVWSFRIDRKYRAIFIFRNSDTVEILDVNNHYQ